VRVNAADPFLIVRFDSGCRAGDPLSTWIEPMETAPIQRPLAMDDIALVTYTSGTTGNPKGVMASHQAFQFSFLIAALETELSFACDDVLLMSMPNFHLGGSWVTMTALYFGATISILPAFDPSLLLAALRRDRPTILPLVPTAIRLLVSDPEFRDSDFSLVRRVIYFGSPIDTGLLARAMTKFRCEFLQYYGTSETWIISALRHQDHLSNEPKRLASCGTPLPLVSMRICDSEGKELPPLVVGEILVRSPTLFSGYHNQPSATEATIADGWYRTGDLGLCDEHGFFSIVDRAKDMIVSGGENVYSAEVESALLKHPGVAQAAVIGVPDARWGEKVVAFVNPVSGATPTEEALQQHCRLHLAGYKVPKTIILDASLPMTSTGKVTKPALRERFRARSLAKS
jgi:acyl-CoA synthetase (AMP-forming)/AMP-acid ligase II